MRLIVVVEGKTEEAFVNEVLGPHLNRRGVFTTATVVGKHVARRRGHHHRGGGPFKVWLEDIRRILRHDTNADLRVTTLFDLYRLPNDFPDLKRYDAEPDTHRRCSGLEDALREAVGDGRFIPYLQCHEFEALVLAALPFLSDLFDAEDDLFGCRMLGEAIAAIPPEEVNDGSETAPSKRLRSCIPGYRKVLHGPAVTARAGVAHLRRACPRFGAWVAHLEGLGTAQSTQGTEL